MDSINKVLSEEGQDIELNYKKKQGLIYIRNIDNMIFVSGHGPKNQLTDEVIKGRVGRDLTKEEGYIAAKRCAIEELYELKIFLGSLDRVKKVIKAFGLVNCSKGFNDIDYVMDGFSDTIIEVFEERGYHVRTAMGTHNLPNNQPVEIEMIVEIY